MIWPFKRYKPLVVALPCGDQSPPLLFDGPPAYCVDPVGHTSLWHRDNTGLSWRHNMPMGRLDATAPLLDRVARLEKLVGQLLPASRVHDSYEDGEPE